MRRALFEAIGGFADRPIQEDVEILRRLKRHGRLVLALPPAVISDRGWQTFGVGLLRVNPSASFRIGGFPIILAVVKQPGCRVC